MSEINWPYMYGFVSGLCILVHWPMSLFLCQYYTDYYNFVIKFEIIECGYL